MKRKIAFKIAIFVLVLVILGSFVIPPQQSSLPQIRDNRINLEISVSQAVDIPSPQIEWNGRAFVMPPTTNSFNFRHGTDDLIMRRADSPTALRASDGSYWIIERALP